MSVGKLETLEPGTLLRDTYTIGHKIASGGMGEVYLAQHARLPGSFAVKILNARLADDARAIARFRREADILALIRHPNVVQVFDFDLMAPGIPFLVMEHVEGRDLAQHVLESGPLPLGRVVQIVQQIAAALEAAHARRVVHGDLKPANVMLAACGAAQLVGCQASRGVRDPSRVLSTIDREAQPDLVKLLDFGVAQMFGTRTGSSEPSNLMLGTPSYMAPEQAEGRNDEIDGRADQFALAVLTYVLLTGADPFPGDSTVEVLARIIHAEPAPLGARVAWPSDGVEAVLRRALSKRAQGRYGCILDFSDELARVARPVADMALPPAPRTKARPVQTLRGAQRSLVRMLRESERAAGNGAARAARPPTGQTTIVARPPAGLRVA